MKSNNVQKVSDVPKFLDSFDTFLLDCDGVLWRGSTLLPRTKEVLQQLRSMGKRLLFVTNNSTKSREDYKGVFAKFGIEVSAEEIISSSSAVAHYLKDEAKFTQTAYVVGEAGITRELDALGISWIGGTDHKENMTMQELEHIELDPRIGAVFVGLDTNINYRKVAYAKLHLRNRPDTLFLATNADSTFPSAGHMLPGSGTMVAMVEACSGRKALVIGKPSKTLVDLIVHQYGLDRERTCMVGDRLNTDIQFGLNGGISTLLVLTGVTSEEELLSPDNAIHPHHYIPAFGDLLLPSSSSSSS
jgi:4-nitrophenyl phosphatase